MFIFFVSFIISLVLSYTKETKYTQQRDLLLLRQALVDKNVYLMPESKIWITRRR